VRSSSSAGARPILPLELPGELRARLLTWSREAHPLEACGLLIGRAEPKTLRVLRAERARNLARERGRYTVAPEDWRELELAARRESLEVVAIWHSHPDSPAEPSPIDRDGAWEGWTHVIVGRAASGVEVRAWLLERDAFVERTVLVRAACGREEMNPGAGA